MLRYLSPSRLPICTSLGLAVLRVVAGLAFIIHGYGKIQNPFQWMGPDANIPGILQAAAAVSEFGGGICWILGLLTPIASLGLLCTMGVAVYTHAQVWNHPFVATGPDEKSFELAAVYFCVALVLLFAGPGSLSIDRLVFGRLRDTDANPKS